MGRGVAWIEALADGVRWLGLGVGGSSTSIIDSRGAPEVVGSDSAPSTSTSDPSVNADEMEPFVEGRRLLEASWNRSSPSSDSPLPGSETSSASSTSPSTPVSSLAIDIDVRIPDAPLVSSCTGKLNLNDPSLELTTDAEAEFDDMDEPYTRRGTVVTSGEYDPTSSLSNVELPP